MEPKSPAKMEEDMQESWVELAPTSRGSCSSITTCTDPGTGLEKLLLEAQQVTPAALKDSRKQSPKCLQSPHVEFECGLESVKYRLTTRDTDWIWDWSSRPEAVPPKELKFRPLSSCGSLNTPPSSPTSTKDPSHFSSLRHSKWIRSELLSAEALWGLLLSNLFTFMVGTCVGFFVGRKYSKPGWSS